MNILSASFKSMGEIRYFISNQLSVFHKHKLANLHSILSNQVKLKWLSDPNQNSSLIVHTRKDILAHSFSALASGGPLLVVVWQLRAKDNLSSQAGNAWFDVASMVGRLLLEQSAWLGMSSRIVLFPQFPTPCAHICDCAYKELEKLLHAMTIMCPSLRNDRTCDTMWHWVILKHTDGHQLQLPHDFWAMLCTGPNFPLVHPCQFRGSKTPLADAEATDH